jgi:hypothetical protein
MSKLVYGRNSQVSFNNEEEKQEAITYILTHPENVNFRVHEDNQNQGAWGPEERIHFLSEDGVPECLKRQMTAGRGDLYGRINCKEFCDELRNHVK